MVLEYPPPNQISGSNQLTIPEGLMEPESLNRSSNVAEAMMNEIEKDHIRYKERDHCRRGCSKADDKPDTIFSGAKRKAITPTEAVADKPSLSSAPVKNVKEWSCALCQVCTTNQDGLNVHFQGKKHKCKEAAFREQKDNKNCGIALSPKKQKFIQLVEHDLISRNQFEEGSSGTNDNDPPSLLIDDGTNDMRKNTIHGKQNNVEFKFGVRPAK
ncbi:hypothetical protein KY284_008694 [Solanum tuberosum]|nr:hypothetical protein KY284_008694 [Solanum tuberosum]